MIAPETLTAVERYWVRTFGLASGVLPSRGVHIVAHAALGSWRGVFVLRRGRVCLVSAPLGLLPWLRLGLADMTCDDLFIYGGLERFLGPQVALAVGPAWLGYGDSSLTVPRSSARLLGPDDAGVLDQLREACGTTAWEHSGIDRARPPVFGLFVCGELVAAGTLREEAGIGNIGIVTHPAHRGHGYATEVVAFACAYGLERNTVLQYRTLLSNGSSMAVARKLGLRNGAAPSHFG